MRRRQTHGGISRGGAVFLLMLGLAFGQLPAAGAQATTTPKATDSASDAVGIQSGPRTQADSAANSGGSTRAPTSAFRDIKLGMDRESVIAALQKDRLFSYRGPEDVSLLPSPNQSLIDVSGLSFVKRAFFQFYDNRLWVMILILNGEKIDHYSVYTSLVAAYGEPSLLDPKEARWEDAKVRMALERPLSLRYMDMDVYKKLQEGASARQSLEELDRRDFLEGL